jgi:hypothetical protein
MNHTEQTYLEKLFPNGRDLPNERLIPALLMQGERTEVLILIKVADEQAMLLRTENDSLVTHTDISVQAVDKAGRGDSGVADLRIGLELTYPDITLRYNGIISDATGQKQASIAAALLQATRIAVFVATYELAFVSFKAFDWNPASLPHLQEILQDYN